MPTSVSLSATITINNQPVVLNTGDLSKITSGGFVFKLTQPIDIGTPNQFITWFNTNLSSSVTLPSSLPSGTPKALEDAFSEFLSGEVILNTVVINQPLQTYDFGISLDFSTNPISFGILALDGLGLLITKQPLTATLNTAIVASATAPGLSLSVQQGQGKNFPTGGGSVQVDNEIMSVGTPTGDSIPVTARAQQGTTAADHAVGANVVIMGS